MVRREMLGLVGAGAVGLAAAGGREAFGEQGHQHDKMHEDCMKECGDCARACNEAAAHCLQMLCENRGDTKMHAMAHSLAMDCAAFCTLSASLIARQSELMTYSCEACAEACRCCAEACEKNKGSQMMSECAKQCRECEESCRQMVKAMKAKSAK